jgi:hypothetical protein
MVKVSVEVRSGSARFWISVQVQSIQQAMNIVAGWHPDSDVRMRFPIDPEGFLSRTLLSAPSSWESYRRGISLRR